MQHVDHVAFNKLTQQAYNQAVKDGMLNRHHFTALDTFWQTTSPTVKDFVLTQSVFQTISQVSDASLLVRHFNPCVQGHMERNSPFVRLSNLIRVL